MSKSSRARREVNRRDAEAVRESLAQDLKFHRIKLVKLSDAQWCFRYRDVTLLTYWPGSRRIGEPGRKSEPHVAPDAAAKRAVVNLEDYLA